jgi:hypothetical protein
MFMRRPSDSYRIFMPLALFRGMQIGDVTAGSNMCGDRRQKPAQADADGPANAEDCVRRNSPAIVFGQIGRDLLVTFAFIGAFQIALNIFHIF